MPNPKRTAPGAAEYTYNGETFTLHRTWSAYHARYKPWVASLKYSYGSGTAEQLEQLAELAARLAAVCRELDGLEVAPKEQL